MRPGSALSGPTGRPLLGPPSAARAGPSPRCRADGCSNIRVSFSQCSNFSLNLLTLYLRVGAVTGRESECGGGPEPGPNPPQYSHTQTPQSGRSDRCLLFRSAPTTPGSLPPPASLPPPPPPYPPRTPHPYSPAQNRRPGPPRPSAGCRGYNGAAEKRDLTFHWGRGERLPLTPIGDPSPGRAPRLSVEKRAVGPRM